MGCAFKANAIVKAISTNINFSRFIKTLSSQLIASNNVFNLGDCIGIVINLSLKSFVYIVAVVKNHLTRRVSSLQSSFTHIAFRTLCPTKKSMTINELGENTKINNLRTWL